jgi:ABC-type nitrate/sulfonate/bicarbonate transport system ATPase subunit
MTFFIDAQNVSVTYHQDDKIHTIFKDLSVRVRRGEFLTVVGPSGCGKSTLLRLLLGAQRPSSGSVIIDGKPVNHVNRDCGIVYQSYSLFQHLTVLDNIALGPLLDETTLWDRFFAAPVVTVENIWQVLVARAKRLHEWELDKLHQWENWTNQHKQNGATAAAASGADSPAASGADSPVASGADSPVASGADSPAAPAVPVTLKKPSLLARIFEFLKYIKLRRKYRESAAQFLSDIGLDPSDGDKYPYELSGGMRQRVAIAQAVIMQPKILLMDEPFGALDKTRREEMQDFIHQQWARFGLTVFFVTHDLDEAVKLGTRLICMSQYWCDENKKPGEGSRIVVDRKVMGGEISPSTFVGSEEFKLLVNKIGKAGLDPHHLQPASGFDLSHEDAIIAGNGKGITA